jgi:geranylgeranyl pyrophosphate synthase
MFEADYERLLPRIRTKDSQRTDHPVAFTETAAYDWLAEGGRRFRPFITLAAWYAATNESVLTAGDATPEIPDDVARVAMAIEAFHKASLVHDDIQDDDAWRYGRKTLHRQHGSGQAINIGDYLIGLGYRLVHAAHRIDPKIAVDVLDSMSTAHLRLCDGQGAEMAWQQSPDWNLTPLDAMQIYAMKTSSAFEAALYSGLRLAKHPLAESEMVSKFCRHLGVGFQILNDLKDWRGDADNKLVAGQDALARRPTILLALALKSVSDDQRIQLEELFASDCIDENSEERLLQLRDIFQACDVFENAELLVQRCCERAIGLIEDVEERPIRDLLHFFLETVLAVDSSPGPAEHLDPSEPVLANLQPPEAPIIQLGMPTR